MNLWKRTKSTLFFRKKYGRMSAFLLSLSVTGSQGEMSGDISPVGRKASCPGRIAAVLLFVIFVFLIQKLLFAGYFYHRTSL